MALPLPLDDGVALGMQQSHARFLENASQQASRANAMDTFAAGQATTGYLRGVNLNDAVAAQTLMGQNNILANSILSQRSARDQPQVAPVAAFTPAAPGTPANPKTS